jgi:hypothetical protein
MRSDAMGRPRSVANSDYRAQVVDAARDIITVLHGEVTEATFSYESCNDQGEAPFRGVVDLSFWMPGVPHNEPADPQKVIKGLVADGWSTNSAFPWADAEEERRESNP